MHTQPELSRSLAAQITSSASKQSYYTIRFLVDRGRVDDAFRAYAYFRWVDDILDSETGTKSDKTAFLHRQVSLLEACTRGEAPGDLCAEEWMLADLLRNNTSEESGLQIYLRNMFDMMAFDTRRRGQVLSQAELSAYSQNLAVAVTEALLYFIGHDKTAPVTQDRYLAVTAAHIIHMLRDTVEDTREGYFNIPREVLQEKGISAEDLESTAYREWVCSRVRLARAYFKAGRRYLAQVTSLRCRLAGYAYTARFEWVLRRIERDGYCLRSAYPSRKSLLAGLWVVWLTLWSMLRFPRKSPKSHDLAT